MRRAADFAGVHFLENGILKLGGVYRPEAELGKWNQPFGVSHWLRGTSLPSTSTQPEVQSGKLEIGSSVSGGPPGIALSIIGLTGRAGDAAQAFSSSRQASKNVRMDTG
jgi:hypothetical protein